MEELVALLASGRNPDVAIQRLADIVTIEPASDIAAWTASEKVAAIVLSTSGALDQLLNLTRNEDDSIKNSALVVLASLCKLFKFRSKVASEHLDQVITVMLSGAVYSSESHDPKQLVQKTSLSALALLARIAKAAQRAAAAGAIDVLVRLLQPSASTVTQDDIKELATEALTEMISSSTNRSRQAVDAGAIAAVTPLTFSQHKGTQTISVICLSFLLGALTPAHMSTHSQYIRVAIAALARTLAPSLDRNTAFTQQETAILGLECVHNAVLTTRSESANSSEHDWADAELAKALARANAGPLLLEIGSQNSITLLVLLTVHAPEQILLLARTEGCIERLKQLTHSREPAVRSAAGGMLGEIRAASPELARLVGSDVDPRRVFEEGLLASASAQAAEASRRSRCARCGAAGGEGGVTLSECSACRMVYYCSKECQKKHWKVRKSRCMPRAY